MKTQIIILAAGLGKRMGSSAIPKVLAPLRGRPMISYLIEAVRQSGVSNTPVVVIGHHGEQVRAALGDDFTYVVQDKLLGTGDAVARARTALEGFAENVLVLYGDKPYISAATIRNMVAVQESNQRVITMATITVPSFEGWYAALRDHGRIIRNSEGKITRTVEEKDATPDELAIKELGTGTFCFQSNWLWQNIHRLTNNNRQGEYYLTDLLQIAIAQGNSINVVRIDPREGLGVNSLEQLELLSGV